MRSLAVAAFAALIPALSGEMTVLFVISSQMHSSTKGKGLILYYTQFRIEGSFSTIIPTTEIPRALAASQKAWSWSWQLNVF